MSLSKAKSDFVDDFDDPFAYLPVEILVMIVGYLKDEPRDLLHLALASPTLRKKVLSDLDLKTFKDNYLMEASFLDGIKHHRLSLHHIHASMSFSRNATEAFHEAFKAVTTWRSCRWPWPAEVVLVIVPDVKVAQQFAAFFEEKATPGFKVVLDSGGQLLAMSDLRQKLAGQVVVFVAHRTVGFLPKAHLVVALDPAGAKCLQRILHLGPDHCKVFWRFNDRIGKNYTSVSGLLQAFNRGTWHRPVWNPVVRILPEGSLLLFLECSLRS